MSFSVEPEQAQSPFVLALDVGSTGTRGGLFDATGLPVRGCRLKIPHAFTTGSDGTTVIDGDQVADELRQIVEFVAGASQHPIAGVALDTFAASLVGVDADRNAITPCFTYADSRCSAEVDQLRQTLDEDATQQRTGTRQHTGYLPPRFLWLRETDPGTFGRVRHWMSLGEYAYMKLIGTTAAGTSTAAWTGMLNRREGTWDAELCALVGVQVEQFSPIAHPSQPLTPKLAPLHPNLADAVWFPPVADGFSSSLGAGGTDSSSIVAAAATSGAMRVLVDGLVDDLPRGLWCYRVDENRSLLGGALNDVGRAVSWLQATLRLPEEPEVLDAALRADPSPLTPLVLPWFTGERSTGWVGQARAEFHRVSAGTTPVDLYRATIEGVALSYQRMLAQLTQAAGGAQRVLATGSVTAEVPGLLQVLADTIGVEVLPITIKRSTLHGTAMQALEILAPEVSFAPVDHGDVVSPVAGREAHYRERVAAFADLYDKVVAR
ncbi:FGGY family carbohydrate kinase [Micropruina sp.]|uniref:FGGY family carbohydrate kinase n=1 Tax=Micropruina sp. TaxID=2737536 RepID=UPI0039E6DD23